MGCSSPPFLVSYAPLVPAVLPSASAVAVRPPLLCILSPSSSGDDVGSNCCGWLLSALLLLLPFRSRAPPRAGPLRLLLGQCVRVGPYGEYGAAAAATVSLPGL